MDFFFKICLGIILIPFFLWGLSTVLQVVLGAGVGIFSLFNIIWNKEMELSYSEGLITGVVFVVARVLLLLLLSFVFSFININDSILVYINNFIYLITTIIFVIALIRKKFKFAFSFFLINDMAPSVVIWLFSLI